MKKYWIGLAMSLTMVTFSLTAFAGVPCRFDDDECASIKRTQRLTQIAFLKTKIAAALEHFEIASKFQAEEESLCEDFVTRINLMDSVDHCEMANHFARAVGAAHWALIDYYGAAKAIGIENQVFPSEKIRSEIEMLYRATRLR